MYSVRLSVFWWLVPYYILNLLSTGSANGHDGGDSARCGGLLSVEGRCPCRDLQTDCMFVQVDICSTALEKFGGTAGGPKEYEKVQLCHFADRGFLLMLMRVKGCGND